MPDMNYPGLLTRGYHHSFIGTEGLAPLFSS